MTQDVLLVDDDPAVGKVLGALLEQAGFATTFVQSGEAAIEALESGPHALVVSDVRMPGMDGLELLRRVGQEWSGLPVVLITAHGTIPLAVEALKAGAADFVLKPFDREEILYIVRKALAASPVARDEVPAAPPTGSAIVGDSASMLELYGMIERVAGGTATVLLAGETGTGKNLVARAIHAQGPRAAAPFVTVQCAALPENLLESELFGYEKGAFTGAAATKPGRVELAEGGTLFLDEIGDVTLPMQVRLLRLLQDREYERLGGTETLTADVRFIAATHRNLEQMVADGEFREDLFYRLSVIPVYIPALRERGGDIGLLARHFAAIYGPQNGKPDVSLTQGALDRLAREPWPGNVRQLQHFLERLVVMSDATTLDAEHVDALLGLRPAFAGKATASAGNDSLQDKRRQAEREAVEDALRRANGNRSQAARLLNISRRTLYNKLEQLGLD
ncbi:MAG: sigma-54 dependent transcriptional regulator [Planctomycetota bacterium]|nr:sigma-54 dependent transcriptional regulator [Planctomycetota bacterium]